jgi:aminoglycoside/choline kinase family phosphotransferase
LSDAAAAASEAAPPLADPRLLGFLAETFGASPPDLTPLAGDASTRAYFRAARGSETFIVALYPEPLPAGRLPFLDVQALLAGWGLAVPAVLECDRARGVMLLSDLGDLSLQELMRSADDAERERVYARALEQAALLQRAAVRWPEREAECFRLAFDVSKLRFELDFFVTHFLCGLRAARLHDAEREVLSRGVDLLCAEIASWPRVLCHRDFHARNLLLHGGDLAWIDFQDARQGPATYDLCSLLRDAYVTLPEDFIAEQAERFRRAALPEVDAATFARRFDWTCLQRNLKALGTFGYMAGVRGKDVYLQYVAPTLRHVARTLPRHAEWAGLRRVLAGHIEELGER